MEPEFASVKTSVWWDIENCAVPRGCDPNAIATNITASLVNAGYRGPVSISAYGDSSRIAPAAQHALSSTAVALNHVPAGVKDASDKKILVDMLFWAVDNPPPANYLLISGDRDFSNALHQLRMRRYNVLLAHAPNVSQALVAAAKCVWHWSSLVTGGPPLSSELSSSSSVTYSNSSVTQIPRAITCEQTQSGKFASGSCTQNAYGKGGIDNGPRVRQKRRSVVSTANSFRPPTQDETSESSDKHSSNAKHPMEQPVVSATTATTSQMLGSEQRGTNLVSPVPQAPSERPVGANSFRVAPHKFYNGSNKSNTACRPMTCRTSSISNCSPASAPLGNNHPISGPRPFFRPIGPPNNQPFFAPTTSNEPNSLSNFSCPQSPRTDSALPLPGFPDFNKMNISAYPGGGNYTGTSHNTYQKRPEIWPSPMNPSCAVVSSHPRGVAPPFHPKPEYQITCPTSSANAYNNGISKMAECHQTTNEMQFHLETVLRALQYLKADELAPTEENIADCIHYGEIHLPNCNVKFGLDFGMSQQKIVKHSLGNSLPLYVEKTDRLWKCVNIMDANAKPTKETRKAAYKFISSPDGQTFLMNTNCRYEAAIVLREHCLKDRPLGVILQFLHRIIKYYKWIKPNSPSGWQPLLIKTSVDLDASSNTSL